MSTIKLSPEITAPFAQADKIALMIDAGWTVLIPPATAVDYVHKFDSSPNYGFFRHNGKVCLTHNSGKLMLSETEADAIVALIRTAYMDR